MGSRERSARGAAACRLARTDRSWPRHRTRAQHPAVSRPRRCGTIRGGSIWSGSLATRRGSGTRRARLVSALDATGTAVLPIEASAAEAAGQAAFPVNVLCMDGDLVPEFVREAGEEFVAGRYSVGLWFWDAGRPPKRMARVAYGDRRAVGAERVRGTAARGGGDRPGTHGTDPGAAGANRRVEAGRTSACQTISSCSVSASTTGADSSAPIQWLRSRRSGRRSPPTRVHGCCCGAGIRRTTATCAERLIDAVAEHPDVELIDACVGLSSLIALCDCYVSLHRAEAFGLPIAQAMWLGKPVIATAYSGNLDYMTPENSYLVRSRLVPIDGRARAPGWPWRVGRSRHRPRRIADA